MAAFDNPVFVKSSDAGADLSTHQYKAVKYDGSGNLAVCGLGESASGFLQNDPNAAGKSGDVMKLGITRAIAGAAIATKGLKLASDASGRVIVASTGHHVIGISEGTAGALGDIIPVLVCLGGAPLP